MKRFFALFKRDMLVGSKNYFFIIVMLTPILLGLLVRFVIPEETSTQVQVLIAMDEQIKEERSDLLHLYDGANQLDSKSAIQEAMKKDVNSYGIVFTKDNESIHAEVIFQGYESQKQRNLVLQSVEMMLNSDQVMQVDGVKTTELGQYSKTTIPFNLQLVPIFIVMEPALLGLFLIATMIFSEKEEKTILAYGVSPGKITEFLLSKVLFMFLLGVLGTFVIMALTVGIGTSFLKVVGILVFANLFGASLGLLISSFFDSISKAMIWVVVASMVLSFPLVAFMIPTFAPAWLKIMPTYPMLYSINEAIFPSGNSTIIGSSILILAVSGLLLFILSVVSYKKTLVRG